MPAHRATGYGVGGGSAGRAEVLYLFLAATNGRHGRMSSGSSTSMSSALAHAYDSKRQRAEAVLEQSRLAVKVTAWSLDSRRDDKAREFALSLLKVIKPSLRRPGVEKAKSAKKKPALKPPPGG